MENKTTLEKKTIKKVDGLLNDLQDFCVDNEITKGQFIDLVKLFITLYYE